MLVLHFALLTILATGSLAVFNGKPATPHQFPYHVGLYWPNSWNRISKLKYYCGGTVVSDRWVLTSAKCAPNLKPIVVRAGKHVVDKEETGEQLRFVVRHIVHPEYKRPTVSKSLIAQNDLAMLQVDKPFVFNKYVRPAGIPCASASFVFGSLAGWGPTNMEPYNPKFPKELHYDELLPVVNAHDCAKDINKLTFKRAFSRVEISGNQICSRPVNEECGTCFKDDGSAFVSRKNKEYVVIGVIAHHLLHCETMGLPTVYTRVGAYFDWINDVIEYS